MHAVFGWQCRPVAGCRRAGEFDGRPALAVVERKGSIMSMNVGSKKGAMANINITPYIDILLVLLIIFMVITPIRQMDLDVKVPQTSNRRLNGRYLIPVLSWCPSAKLRRLPSIRNRQRSSDLGAKLQEIYSKRANKNMFISASAKLPYGDVVRVIDIAKGSRCAGYRSANGRDSVEHSDSHLV